MSTNASGATGGSVTTKLENITAGNILTAFIAGYGERTEDVYHNVSGIGYFAAGNTFRLTGIHTIRFRFQEANISVVAYGN